MHQKTHKCTKNHRIHRIFIVHMIHRSIVVQVDIIVLVHDP